MESSKNYAFASHSKSCTMTPASPSESPERAAGAGSATTASRAFKAASAAASLLPGFVPKFPSPDATAVPTTPKAVAPKSFACPSLSGALQSDAKLLHFSQLPPTGVARPLSASRGYYPTPEPSSSTGGPGALSDPGAFHEEEDEDDAKCVPPSSPSPDATTRKMPMMASSPQYASLSDEEEEEEEEDAVPRLPDTKYMAAPGSRAASSPPADDSFGAHMDTGVTRLDFSSCIVAEEEDKHNHEIIKSPMHHQPLQTQINNHPTLHPPTSIAGQPPGLWDNNKPARNITTSATPVPFTVRSPFAGVTVARVSRSGRPLTIGRSSKSCDVALPCANRLVSRIHVRLRIVERPPEKSSSPPSASLAATTAPTPRLRVTCLGWNGCTVVVPAFRTVFLPPQHDAYGPKQGPPRVERVPDGVTDYLVPKGLEIEVDYVAGITIDVRGERALVELTDENSKQEENGTKMGQQQEESQEQRKKQQTLRERRATKLNVPPPQLAPVNITASSSTASAPKPRPSSAFFTALHGSAVSSLGASVSTTSSLVTPTSSSAASPADVSRVSSLPRPGYLEPLQSSPAIGDAKSAIIGTPTTASGASSVLPPMRPPARMAPPHTPVTAGAATPSHGTPASARKRKSDVLDGALVGAYLASKGVSGAGLAGEGGKREKKQPQQPSEEGLRGGLSRDAAGVRGLARSQSQRVAIATKSGLGSPSRRGLAGSSSNEGSTLVRSQSMAAVRLGGATTRDHEDIFLAEGATKSSMTREGEDEYELDSKKVKEEYMDEEEEAHGGDKSGVELSFQHIQQVVSTHLALSRAHSSPLSVLMRSIPSLGSGVGSARVRAVLTATAWIGVITRQGKDAAGKPLEEEYYYVPEKDTDADRRALVDQLKGRGATGLRACRKTHKQYYWKKPRN